MLVPGWPIDSAPAVSRPIRKSRSITSGGPLIRWSFSAPFSAPSVFALSGRRFTIHGSSAFGSWTGAVSGIVSEIAKAPFSASHAGS